MWEDGWCKQGREDAEGVHRVTGVGISPHGEFEPLRSKINPSSVVSGQAEIVLPPPQCVGKVRHGSVTTVQGICVGTGTWRDGDSKTGWK